MKAAGIIPIVLGGFAILGCGTYFSVTPEMFVQGIVGLAAVLCGAGSLAVANIHTRLKRLESRTAQTEKVIRSPRPSEREENVDDSAHQLREADLLSSATEISDQDIGNILH